MDRSVVYDGKALNSNTDIIAAAAVAVGALYEAMYVHPVRIPNFATTSPRRRYHWIDLSENGHVLYTHGRLTSTPSRCCTSGLIQTNEIRLQTRATYFDII